VRPAHNKVVAIPFPRAEKRLTPAQRLAALIRAHCPHDGRFPLRVPGLHVARYSHQSKELNHSTPRPVLCIVAQGAKTIFLGAEAYFYDGSRLLILSVDLPVAAEVTRASLAEPYLSLIVDLEPRRIAELVMKVYPHGLPRVTAESRGVCVAPSSPVFLEAAARLIETMAVPEEAELLAPLIIDEILIRLLRSPAGARVAQMGWEDSHVHRVARAIAWLRANYAQPMRVEKLAGLAHMSVSAFHQHFKAVTSMSPLHYQKTLRLQEARRLMLTMMLDAGSAARQVGYLSASQFSREYARFFGVAPTRDIARLLAHGLKAADVVR
jgi:AraC-like DNA-binding protein